MLNVDSLTAKHFGDACEYSALAELGFAGHAAVKMPDGNRGFDLLLVAQPHHRISVRGLRAGLGAHGKRKRAGFWLFDPDGFDWIVLTRVNIETGARLNYVVPRDKALALSKPHSKRRRRMSCWSKELSAWANNFALKGATDDKPSSSRREPEPR
jgi:hypothetical protein